MIGSIVVLIRITHQRGACPRTAGELRAGHVPSPPSGVHGAKCGLDDVSEYLQTMINR